MGIEINTLTSNEINQIKNAELKSFTTEGLGEIPFDITKQKFIEKMNDYSIEYVDIPRAVVLPHIDRDGDTMADIIVFSENLDKIICADLMWQRLKVVHTEKKVMSALDLRSLRWSQGVKREATMYCHNKKTRVTLDKYDRAPCEIGMCDMCLGVGYIETEVRLKNFIVYFDGPYYSLDETGFRIDNNNGEVVDYVEILGKEKLKLAINSHNEDKE